MDISLCNSWGCSESLYISRCKVKNYLLILLPINFFCNIVICINGDVA